MDTYEIILFYKYVRIDNPAQLMLQQKELQQRLDIKGRTIISEEGINATLEGTTSAIEIYLAELFADARFIGTHIKRDPGTGNAFPRTSVKVRKEIVALGLDSTCDINPNELTGKRLKPEELHRWITEKREFYIIDMRNAYEHLVGHFAGSILPAMDNFRQLPEFVDSISHLQNKTIVTVCTGGVRCEKASGYLLSQGFTDVYQLDGGIVSYMRQFPNEDFLGKLYVFDNRIAIGFFTDDPKHQVIGKCLFCQQSSERYTNCLVNDCNRKFIACEVCEQNLGNRFWCPSELGHKAKTRVS
ncbi:MAG TPA: rhodanese-related sulfurtransferase [Candidatus Doudnabacteria bacterium]|nr:rhodanese-related sulfurtransferase [Candidatus Doudnabacteria bacterium]